MALNDVPSGSDEPAAPWSTLSEKQRIAAEETVLGMSCAEIGKKHHYDRTTVWRWTQRKDFQSYVRWLEHQRETLILDRLQSVVLDAVECISAAVQNGDAKAAIGYLNVVVKLNQERTLL